MLHDYSGRPDRRLPKLTVVPGHVGPEFPDRLIPGPPGQNGVYMPSWRPWTAWALAGTIPGSCHRRASAVKAW